MSSSAQFRSAMLGAGQVLPAQFHAGEHHGGGKARRQLLKQIFESFDRFLVVAQMLFGQS
jgi:hypothetical protein